MVRLIVDTRQDGGPVINLPVGEVRRLLAGAERDLADFFALAVDRAPHHLGDRSGPVVAALARALGVPAPTSHEGA
ncbi:MAG TPA: hypothetical protein VFW65_18825 [Pseudonocardiaceae bacterium]|nr:hypothetical protein [Pseudonocardiaceae bacterium]